MIRVPRIVYDTGGFVNKLMDARDGVYADESISEWLSKAITNAIKLKRVKGAKQVSKNLLEALHKIEDGFVDLEMAVDDLDNFESDF